MSISDFEILSKLGEGSFSGVFKVIRKSDNQIYALKQVKLRTLKQKEKENSLNEVRILASFNHPNIIAYKEAFIDEPTNTLCIVMEIAEHGDLLKKITENKKTGTFFPEEEIWQALVQITQGLKSLHDKNILHRDLKGANIFISKEGIMKLGDLNVSKVNKKGLAYTQTGTPYYASPEVWQDKPYNSSSDIWSLGCVIYEMTALAPPFTANDMKGLYTKVVSGNYPNIPSRYSTDLSNTIRSFLQVSPNLRPTCDKILDMPTVKRHLITGGLLHVDRQQIDLLGTIHFESALKNIQKKLPAANYESDSQIINRTDNYQNPFEPSEEYKRNNKNLSDRNIPLNNNNVIKKGHGISPPSMAYLDINNHSAADISHNSQEHVPVIKGDFPIHPRSKVDQNQLNLPRNENYRKNSPQNIGKPPSIESYLQNIEKEPLKPSTRGVPNSNRPNSRGNNAEIYNNYPDIRPNIPQGNIIKPSSRDQKYVPPNIPKSRPNSNLGKVGAVVLQSPKNLVPKALPSQPQYRGQRVNNLW